MIRAMIRAVLAAVLAVAGLAVIAPATASAQQCGPITILGDGVGGGGVAIQWANVAGFPVNRLNYTPDSTDGTNRVGIDLFKQEYRAFQSRCPGTMVYAVGHSAGALAIGDAIAELVREGTNVAPIRADLIADPRRPGNDNGRGIELVFPNIAPGFITMQGARSSLGNAVVRETCNARDLVCNMANPWTQPVNIDRLIGYFTGQHTGYPPGAPIPPTASADVVRG